MIFDFGVEEIADLASHLLTEDGLKMPINNLILFIPEHGGTCGVEINHGAVVGGLDTDKESGETAVGPVLEDDFLIKLELLLDLVVKFVIHFLVVLDGGHEVHVEVGDLLAVGELANVLVTLTDLLADFYSRAADLVQFLEIRVILVQHRPKLQVN